MKIIGPNNKNFGIRKKIFLTVIITVILSIGFSTLISSIRLIKNLLVETSKSVFQETLTIEKYTKEKINSQLDLLINVAISETVQSQLRIRNAENDNLSDEEFAKKISEIEKYWKNGDEDAEVGLLQQTINENSVSIFLTRFLDSHNEEVEIFITDAAGTVYSMSNMTTDFWQADELWWQESFSGKPYISAPVYDDSSKTWAMIIAVPIYDSGPSTEVIGVVRGTVDITKMFEAMLVTESDSGFNGAFISNDKKIYYQSNDELIVQPISEEMASFIGADTDEISREIVDMYNIPSIASKTEFKVFEYSLGWIVVFVPKSKTVEMITTSITGNVFVGLVLAIILGMFSLVLSNSILNVLRTVNQDASRLAIGDYSYQFSDQLINSNDPDISSLVGSIEKMKDAIQNREYKILEREKEYRQLVETMSEGLAVLIPDGTISYVNPRLCQMLGYEHDEIVGEFFLKFYAEDRKESALALWKKPDVNIAKLYESKLVTKSGEIVHAAISTVSQFDESGKYAGRIAVITDISDRKAYELNLQRKLEEISGLREIDTAILDQANYRGVIDTVLKQFKEHLHADGAIIYVLSPKSQAVEYASAFCNNEIIEFEDIKIDYDHIKLIAELKEGRQINQDTESSFVSDLLCDKQYATLYIMPIFIKNTYHGFAEIAYFNEVELNEEWHNYFNALLTQTAVGISKIALIEDLRTRNVELKESQDSIIRGWAKALELRDEETKGHSDRVHDLSIKMAKINHFTGRSMEAFKRGALLHDIGKMGIPDSILLKPGKLSADEWDIMKLHPDLAYVLLSEIPFLKDAVEIPYCHHERWDGSGYPSGLKGEDIPLAARIFAIVDVWDALTSDRPYRKAWSVEKTRQYMIENKGVLFDPELVDQFLDLLVQEKTLETPYLKQGEGL